MKMKYSNQSALGIHFLLLLLIGATIVYYATNTCLANAWNPTLLVNTEAFQVIDDSDFTSNLEMRFGLLLDAKIVFNRSVGQFQVTKDFTVQGNITTTGALSVRNGSTLSGSNTLIAQNDPSPPGTGSLALYARTISGKPMIKVMGPSGVDYPLQPSFFTNAIAIISAGATTVPNVIGTAITSSATISHPAATEALGYNTNFATSTISGNASGLVSTNAQWFRGSTSNGSTGFFFNARVVTIDTTSVRVFAGLTSATSLANVFTSDDPANDRAGFGFSTVRGDTNWQLTLKDNATQNLINTGVPFVANAVYDLYIYTRPYGSIGAGTLYWRIDNINSATSTEGSNISQLPRGNVALRIATGVQTQTTVAKNFRMNRIYIGGDR